MATITTTIPASQSVYVDSANPTKNYSTSPAKVYLSDTSGKKYAFLKFDTSSLPQGKKITAFTLKLYLTKITRSGNTPNYVYIGGLVDKVDLPNLTELTYNNTNGNATASFYGSLNICSASTSAYSSLSLKLASGAISNQFKLALTRAIRLKISESFSGYSGYVLAAEIAGAGTTNKPQLEVTMTDVSAYVSNCSPSSGFVNRNNDITFSWTAMASSTENLWGTLKGESALFRYRLSGAGDYTEVSVKGSEYTLPKDSLPSGDVQWQVVVTTNAGTTATSQWNTISTVDADAIAAVISPAEQYLNRDEVNVFSWSHSNANGTEQTAADLEYSADGSTWVSLAKIEGNAQSIEIPAGTLPSGTLNWRVRSYNANNVAGPWSDSAVIIVTGEIAKPVFSGITQSARPVVSWTSDIQQAYELVILNESDKEIWSSGIVLSTDKSRKTGAYLPDGSYTAMVRILDANGEVSGWSECDFVVDTEKPAVPIIQAEQIENGIRLSVAADENDTVYILRDGVVLGKAFNGIFDDYTANGECEYIARSVSGDDNYSDSSPVKCSLKLKYAVLAVGDAPSDYALLKFRRDEPPAQSVNWSPIGNAFHFFGQRYPKYEYSGFIDQDANYSFSFTKRSDFLAFMDIASLRKVLLLRDTNGLRVYGTVTGISWEVTPLSIDVSFSFSRVEFNEGCCYD